jgi:hypothetical protein
VVEHVVVLPDGSRLTIPPPAAHAAAPDRERAAPAASADEPAPDRVPADPAGLTPHPGPADPHGTGIPTRRAPLGLVCGARSGDKGGNANVGLWAKSPEAYGWLRGYLDVARLRELLPEADGLEVRRYELPNLQALNFVVVGLLGLGVAASARPDPQAKGLGEYLRSRYADIPVRLLPAR